MADSPLQFKDVNNIADPLLSFKWLCTYLPPLAGFTLPPTYVEGADVPFPEIQQKEGIFAAGTFTYLPGYEQFSAFNVKVYEDSKLRALKYLTAWRNAIREPTTGLYYLEGNYKHEIHFSLYDQQNKELAQLKLYGCWPTSLGPLPLGQDSERVILQQNFSCDGLELKFV